MDTREESARSFPFARALLVLLTIGLGSATAPAQGLPFNLPSYHVGGPEPFQNPPRSGLHRPSARFGVLPAASTGCSCVDAYSLRSESSVVDDQDSGGVSLALGRYFWSLSAITLPGVGMPIDFQITYNSHLNLGPTGSVLGKAGWLHSYQRALFKSGDNLVRVDGSMARTDLFTRRSDGFYEARGWPALIRQNRDKTFTLRLREGLNEIYHPFDNTPLAGRLLRLEDANLQPNSVRLTYTVTSAFARVDEIHDTYGRRALKLRYNGSTGLLEQVADLIDTTRVVRLRFDRDQNLQDVQGPISPANPNRRFAFVYKPGRLLHHIIYPNEIAAGLSEARIIIDTETASSRRVIRLRRGGTNATRVGVSLNPARFRYLTRGTVPFTQVIDRAGNVTDYDISPSGRVSKKTEHERVRPAARYVTTVAYDAEGFETAIVRPEGDTTVHTWQAGGSRFQIADLLEVKHLPGPRSADQNQIVTRILYEPIFNQPFLILDPRQNDPGFTPPFGGPVTTFRYVEARLYEYQEAPTIPTREQGWGLAPGFMGLGDLNGNGVPGGCNVLALQILPSTTLPDKMSVLPRLRQFQYNPAGQPTKSIDPGRVATLLEYETSGPTKGFLKKVTADSDAGSIYPFHEPIAVEFAWNPIGDLQSMIDGRGVEFRYQTNEVHLRTQVTHATSINPGRRNEFARITPLSIVFKTIFDANDNPVRLERDNRNNASTHTGGFIKTRTTYDILDDPIRRESEVTSAAAIVETMGYDDNQNQSRYTKGQASGFASIRRRFDSRDLMFQETRGDGAEGSTFTHFVNGNGFGTGWEDAVDNAPGFALPKDGKKERRTLVRDGFDRVVKIIDRLGNEVRTSYDPASNAIVEEFHGHPADEPLSPLVKLRETQIQHDEASQQVFVKHALLLNGQQQLSRAWSKDTDDQNDANFVTVTNTYDPNGYLVKFSVPNRAMGPQDTSTILDGHGRPRVRTGPEGNRIDFLYNNNGEEVRRTETDVSRVASSERFTFQTDRDAIGRIVKSIDPLNHVKVYTWGTLFRTAMTDGVLGGTGVGNRTRWMHDGVGRPVKTDREMTVSGRGGDTLDPVNSNIVETTQYLDAVRQVIQTDDNNNRTITTRDTRDNVVLIQWADGTRTETTYNLDDDPVRVVDQNRNVVQQERDPIGRMFQRSLVTRAPGVVGTSVQGIAYDGASNVTTTFDDGNLGVYSLLQCRYDSFGNRIEEEHSVGLLPFPLTRRVVSVAHKSISDPVQCTYPNGRKIKYATDRIDRLVTITNDTSPLAKYDYIGTWRPLRRTYGNGVITTFTWDRGRRNTGVDHRTTTRLAGFEAGHNEENFLVWQKRLHFGGRGERIALDSKYRVRQYRDGVADPSRGGAGTRLEETFQLDGVGNWSRQTIRKNLGSVVTNTTAVNRMNSYTSFANKQLVDDRNGNRVRDGRYAYDWDFLNRPNAVLDSSGRGSLYFYHVDGRRSFQITIDPATGVRATDFAWCGNRMIEENDIVPLGGTKQTVFGRGFELLSRFVGSTQFYYHEDCKRWVTALTDHRGVVKERYRYSAYGSDVEFLDAAGRSLPSRAADSPWLYHGYFRDAHTEQFYTVHRYLDPVTGRWLSRDPMGFHDGMGLHEFTVGSPASFVDHDGRLAWFVPPIVIGIAALLQGCGKSKSKGTTSKQDIYVFKGGGSKMNLEEFFEGLPGSGTRDFSTADADDILKIIGQLDSKDIVVFESSYHDYETGWGCKSLGDDSGNPISFWQLQQAMNKKGLGMLFISGCYMTQGNLNKVSKWTSSKITCYWKALRGKGGAVHSSFTSNAIKAFFQTLKSGNAIPDAVRAANRAYKNNRGWTLIGAQPEVELECLCRDAKGNMTAEACKGVKVNFK